MQSEEGKSGSQKAVYQHSSLTPFSPLLFERGRPVLWNKYFGQRPEKFLAQTNNQKKGLVLSVSTNLNCYCSSQQFVAKFKETWISLQHINSILLIKQVVHPKCSGVIRLVARQRGWKGRLDSRQVHSSQDSRGGRGSRLIGQFYLKFTFYHPIIRILNMHGSSLI